MIVRPSMLMWKSDSVKLSSLCIGMYECVYVRMYDCRHAGEDVVKNQNVLCFPSFGVVGTIARQCLPYCKYASVCESMWPLRFYFNEYLNEYAVYEPSC